MLRCFPSRCNRLRHSELWLTWLSRSGGVKGGGGQTLGLSEICMPVLEHWMPTHLVRGFVAIWQTYSAWMGAGNEETEENLCGIRSGNT